MVVDASIVIVETVRRHFGERRDPGLRRQAAIEAVAEVAVGPQPRQGAVSRDGRGEAVAGMVIMLRGANSKDVVTRVKEAVPRIARSLPHGVSLNVFYDRTSLIEACIETVVDALMEGGIFVILVLFLFVAGLRTALIVVASLPITFLGTFLIMGRPAGSTRLAPRCW